MKFLISAILLMSLSLPAGAQTPEQKRNECVTTVRARSMSISKAQAETICEGGNVAVADCVISKTQSAGSSKLEDMTKACTTQMTRRRDRVRKKNEEAKKQAEDAKKAAKEAADKATMKPDPQAFEEITSEDEDSEESAKDKAEEKSDEDSKGKLPKKTPSKDGKDKSSDSSFEDI